MNLSFTFSRYFKNVLLQSSFGEATSEPSVDFVRARNSDLFGMKDKLVFSTSKQGRVDPFVPVNPVCATEATGFVSAQGPVPLSHVFGAFAELCNSLCWVRREKKWSQACNVSLAYSSSLNCSPESELRHSFAIKGELNSCKDRGVHSTKRTEQPMGT